MTGVEQVYALPFDAPLARERVHSGGKGAALADMIAAGLRVPPGFAVTVRACREALAAPQLGEAIAAAAGDAGDEAAAVAAADHVRALILDHEVPDRIRDAIVEAYRDLGAALGTENPAVAVRSSAVAEDGDAASFAGEYESYLWIRGEEEVVAAVRRCWASLFNRRAIVYVSEHGMDAAAAEMAVVVQLMVDARVAGVMFTVNPLSGDPSRISIEANWGLGLSVVGGEVTPDRYLVDRVNMTVCDRRIADKTEQYVAAARAGDDGNVELVAVPDEQRKAACLDDDEVLEIARLGVELHTHHGGAQDVEWALDARLPFPENVLLVQRRPVTVHGRRPSVAIAGQGVTDWIVANLTKDRR
ncbi:PEP/pyruvate-binding domain-containing protein [Capillimicrobium parvum]|uniref:Phosphoenolpyruvate synthase n=1 Tax=Capillimicrobium parvum TaxID=2884022 RepID=A0A9E6XTV7_9ACTN|nr:PEP/pyruvate-binding domain-containing protein [Capillimicrobium parvum]UGS34397.1 Prodigiosin synthesizing transferase PigC [Capillimicrobium parvum]